MQEWQLNRTCRSIKLQQRHSSVNHSRRYIQLPAPESVEDLPAPTVVLSLQDRMDQSIGSVSQAESPITKEPAEDSIKQEFTRYSTNGIRGPLLEILNDALSSAQPTSTQAERNFSLAASIATKKRSKLDPGKLNACCFLKSYFLYYARK